MRFGIGAVFFCVEFIDRISLLEKNCVWRNFYCILFSFEDLKRILSC